MKFLLSNFQALLALSFALGSQAHPAHSVVKRLDKYDATSDCQPWHSEEDSKNLWHDSLAGVIGDDFINEHGLKRWALELDKEVFNEPQNSWFCEDPFTQCEVDKECRDFADKGVEGAYYLLLSLQNAIGVMRSVREYLVEDAVKEHLNVPQITDDFRKEASEEEVDVLALTSAMFAMMGGAVAPIAPLAGAAGFASGMLSAASALEAPEPDKTEDFEGRLADMVLKVFQSAQDKVDDIIGAMVGEEGKDQDLIPQEMQKQSFDNAAINALADGQWLSDDPGQGVKESLDTAYIRHKQYLAWTMIRFGRKAFYYLDTGADKEKCGDGDDDKSEEFWSDSATGCAKLMEIEVNKDGKATYEYTPQDIHDKLWGNDGKYNLDVKETFQNAYECWVDNDGKVGKADIENSEFSDRLSLPKCWFGIPIVRGSKQEGAPIWGAHQDYFELDEFPGQEKGRKWYGKFNADGRVDYAME